MNKRVSLLQLVIITIVSILNPSLGRSSRKPPDLPVLGSLLSVSVGGTTLDPIRRSRFSRGLSFLACYKGHTVSDSGSALFSSPSLRFRGRFPYWGSFCSSVPRSPGATPGRRGGPWAPPPCNFLLKAVLFLCLFSC